MTLTSYCSKFFLAIVRNDNDDNEEEEEDSLWLHNSDGLIMRYDRDQQEKPVLKPSFG